jgi:hypothetical protein
VNMYKASKSGISDISRGAGLSAKNFLTESRLGNKWRTPGSSGKVIANRLIEVLAHMKKHVNEYVFV